MNNMMILEQFEVYLLTERRVAINTFNAYKQDITQLIIFLDKTRKLFQEVTIKELKSFLKQLHKQGVASHTISRKISAIKTFYGYMSERFGYKNCAKELCIPKMEKRLPHYLSEQEIAALFKATSDDTSLHGMRNKVMICLMYTSGMRVSELITLKRADFHFDTGCICVMGKGGKQRMIPIPQKVLSLVKDYIDILIRPDSNKKRAKNSAIYLFPTQYAGVIKPITRQSFWMILKEIWKKTGIKKEISPHQLRHSLATHMLKGGVDLRSLQMILGHENLATVQIYTHVETSYLRVIYNDKHPRS